MSIVIQAENIGKKYTLSHQQKQQYYNFRDVMTDVAKRLRRRLFSPFRSRPSRSELGPSTEEFWALKDVSFEINQGDRVGIIGRNGAGKSTLLKILSRITEPTAGRVTLEGRVASLLEVGTGFHPELTGRENIYLNGAVLGMSKAEIRQKFDEIVDFAEVEKFLDTPVKRYSSGMYVRLAFAVAAHLEPEILVVDEVLAVGDAQFQKKCLGKMEDVSTKEGRTVLFVSHNIQALSTLCTEGILLHEGVNHFWGKIENTISQYEKLINETVKRSKLKSDSIIQEATILGITKSFKENQIGHNIEIMFTIQPPEDDLGIDIYLKFNNNKFSFAASAYYNSIRISKNVRRVKCTIGPVNFSVGKYSIDVNVVKPMVALVEENPNILEFDISENLTVNPYNFQLQAQWNAGFFAPPQKWEIIS
jgi:lipopolysaccharide transport system ATP-binding protein